METELEVSRVNVIHEELEEMKARFKFYNEKYVELNSAYDWDKTIDADSNLYKIDTKRKWCRKEIARLHIILRNYATWYL